MISARIPGALYPGLAYDGTVTFAGVLQSYFSVKDATGKNVGISREWNDNTATQYLRDYTERILPVILRLFGPQKPMHEYLESDFEMILFEINAIHHYADSTLMHYRHLLWSAYSMGVSQNLYTDHIYWDLAEEEEDPEKKELSKARSLTRIRKSLSIKEDIRMLLWFCSLDPITATGEEIGIALMYFLGIRDNEACGASFGDIRMMANHKDMAVFTVCNTTRINSNKPKASGKTGNAPRELPFMMHLYQFCEKRRAWIQCEVDKGNVILPSDIASIDLLPIACKGHNITKRAKTSDLSIAGRALLLKIGISKSELAELHRILLSADFQDTILGEKNPSIYLLRRNTATKQYTLGFEWEVIQYWIAHEIESPLLRRNFFSDEETLYELGKKYEQHPSFQILNYLSNEKVVQPTDTDTYCLNPEHSHIVDLEAREPNQPIFITVRSKSNFYVVQTEIETGKSPDSLVSIDHALHKAYWETFQTYTGEEKTELLQQ